MTLTADQVEQHHLPLVERLDRRDGHTRLVAESEAMPQAILVELVRQAIVSLLVIPLDRVHARERRERQAVLRRLGRP